MAFFEDRTNRRKRGIVEENLPRKRDSNDELWRVFYCSCCRFRANLKLGIHLANVLESGKRTSGESRFKGIFRAVFVDPASRNLLGLTSIIRYFPSA